MFIQNTNNGHTISINASERDYLLLAGDIFKSNQAGVYYPDEHDWDYIVKRIKNLRGE